MLCSSFPLHRQPWTACLTLQWVPPGAALKRCRVRSSGHYYLMLELMARHCVSGKVHCHRAKGDYKWASHHSTPLDYTWSTHTSQDLWQNAWTAAINNNSLQTCHLDKMWPLASAPIWQLSVDCFHLPLPSTLLPVLPYHLPLPVLCLPVCQSVFSSCQSPLPSYPFPVNPFQECPVAMTIRKLGVMFSVHNFHSRRFRLNLLLNKTTHALRTLPPPRASTCSTTLHHARLDWLRLLLLLLLVSLLSNRKWNGRRQMQNEHGKTWPKHGTYMCMCACVSQLTNCKFAKMQHTKQKQQQQTKQSKANEN